MSQNPNDVQMVDVPPSGPRPNTPGKGPDETSGCSVDHRKAISKGVQASTVKNNPTANPELERIRAQLEEEKRQSRSYLTALEKAQADIQRLRGDNVGATVRLETRLGKLQADNIMLQRTVSEFESILNEEQRRSRSHLMELSKARTNFRKINDDQYKAITNLEATVDELRVEKFELEQRIQDQENSVTRAQTAALNLLSGSVSSHLPDDTIKREFADVFELTEIWARENAIESLESIKSSGYEKKLVEWGVVTPPQGADGQPDMGFDWDEGTAGATLLNAAVNAEITSAFLSSPFFITESGHPLGEIRARSPKHVSNAFLKSKALLDALMEEFIKTNGSAKAFAWRACTVQMLSDVPVCREILESYCKQRIDDFIADYTPLISPEAQQEAKASLGNPFIKMGKFALRLWSTKLGVETETLDEFHDRPFAQQSDTMQAARAVRLDENDASLNGRPIQVVLQPLIVGIGETDGKGSGKKRVWSKAIVWVSRRNKPQPKPVQRQPAAKPSPQLRKAGRGGIIAKTMGFSGFPMMP